MAQSSRTGPDPYDDALSAARGHVEGLAVALATWSHRDDSKPQPEVRRAANNAMDEIDGMVRDLYAMRSRLVGEIRAADDATAARVDALLQAGR